MKRKNYLLPAVCPKSNCKKNQQNCTKILECKGVGIGTDGLWGDVQRDGVNYYLQYSIFSVTLNSWLKLFHSTSMCGMCYQARATEKDSTGTSIRRTVSQKGKVPAKMLESWQQRNALK